MSESSCDDGRLVRLDVSAALEAELRPSTIAAEVYWPAKQPKAVLVCLPGGSYARSYWEFSAVPGYSFASFMVDKGFAVVTADPLGVGESSRPVHVDAVTLEVMADAAAEFVRQLRGELTIAADVPVVGVGHSLGGCLMVIAQARHRCYDRIVSLGYTHGAKDSVTTGGAGEDGARAAAIEQAKAFFADWDAGYALAPREPNHAWLYTASTPPPVIAADDATVARWPRQAYVEALLAGYTVSYAKQVTCPVLLGFGDHDIPERPHDDVGFYTASGDVTLLIVPDSGHCHNFSPNRHALWTRIGDWTTARPML